MQHAHTCSTRTTSTPEPSLPSVSPPTLSPPQPQHVIKGFKNFNNSGGPDVFRQAVADHWLFSLVDYFVISFGSGFGRTAYFRSLKTQGAYSVSPGTYRRCDRGEYDFHDYLARLGTRI